MDIGAWELSAALVKALTYAATLGAAGLALFYMYAPPPDASRAALRPLAALCIASFVFSLLRLSLLAGAMGGLAATVDVSLLRRMLASGEGSALLIRAGGLALLGAGAFLAGPVRALLLAGALLTAASFAITGHVHARHSPPLAALLAVHLACAAFWLGALWPLANRLRSAPAQAAPVLARFSRLALGLVPLLLLAGLVLAAVLLGSVSALWNSAYGRWLCLKILLVSVLLALAALNRLRLTPRLGSAGGGAALRLAIRVEIIVAAGVLAATAALTTFGGPGE